MLSCFLLSIHKGLVCEEGIFLHLLVDASANTCDNLLVGRIDEYLLNPSGNLNHQILLGTTCGDSGSTQTDTRGLECAAAIEGHHVLVYGDEGDYPAKNIEQPISTTAYLSAMHSY